MNYERDLQLTFGKNVDVTKLTYAEMIYFTNKNVYLYINFLICKHSGKR